MGVYITSNCVLRIDSIPKESDSFFWKCRSCKSVFLEKYISISLRIGFGFYVSGGIAIDGYGSVGVMYHVEKTNRIFLGGVFVLYQILVSPIYIWYAFVYPKDLFNLIILLLAQMASVAVFYMIALMSHKTIVGFLVVFIALLLAFH